MEKFTNLKTRYIVVKLILDSKEFPNGDEDNLSTKTIFSSSDANTLSIEVKITKQEGYQANYADLRIFGLNKEDIDIFSRFQFNISQPVSENTIEIYAGYELNSNNLPPFIYKGTVLSAYPDYNDANKPFIINSITGLSVKNKIINSLNLQANVTIDDVLKNIITTGSGLAYQPYMPLTEIIKNPNFSGTLIEQLNEVCEHNGLLYKQSDDFRTIYVTKIGQPYLEQNQVINANNYLLGYPIVVGTAVMFRMRYNGFLQFGQKISIESEMSLANGNQWYVNAITHNLMTKGIAWESYVTVQSFQFGA